MTGETKSKEDGLKSDQERFASRLAARLESKDFNLRIAEGVHRSFEKRASLRAAKAMGKTREQWLTNQLETMASQSSMDPSVLATKIAAALPGGERREPGSAPPDLSVLVAHILAASDKYSASLLARVGEIQNAEQEDLLPEVVSECARAFLESPLDDASEKDFVIAVASQQYEDEKASAQASGGIPREPEVVAAEVDAELHATKAAYKSGNGEGDPFDLVEYLVDLGVTLLCTLVEIALAEGAEKAGEFIGSLIGSAFDPGPAKQAAKVGGQAGRWLGTTFAPVIIDGLKNLQPGIVSAVKQVVQSVASLVRQASSLFS